MPPSPAKHWTAPSSHLAVRSASTTGSASAPESSATSPAHVPPGRDATISSWRKDLRLRNPFPHPLKLCIDSGNDRLTVSFRSPVARLFQVEIQSSQISQEPETVAISAGKSGQPGSHGFSTRTWRITHTNGIDKRELISEDNYPAPSRVIAGGGN